MPWERERLNQKYLQNCIISQLHTHLLYVCFGDQFQENLDKTFFGILKMALRIVFSFSICTLATDNDCTSSPPPLTGGGG